MYARVLPAGVEPPAPSSQSFLHAFQEYLHITQPLEDLASLGVHQLDDGPFADCPICACHKGGLGYTLAGSYLFCLCPS